MSIIIGDKVKYRPEYLRSIGGFAGPLPWARGVVKFVQRINESEIFAFVDWGNPDVPNRVNVKNLEKCR
jgi:hypothetical protein